MQVAEKDDRTHLEDNEVVKVDLTGSHTLAEGFQIVMHMFNYILSCLARQYLFEDISVVRSISVCNSIPLSSGHTLTPRHSSIADRTLVVSCQDP